MPEINTEADERLSAQVSEVIAKYDLLCGKMNTAVDEKTARAETAANNAASTLEELKNTLIAGDYATNTALSAEQSRVNMELAKKVATVSVNSPLLATKSGTEYVIKFDGEETAGFHNSIYRGKFLGNSVTDSQWQAISSGKFTDLFIGDYWEIGRNSKNGVNRWRIAAFDYYYKQGYDGTTGPKNNFHHAVIVPDYCLDYLNMNDLEEYQENDVTKTREKKTGYYNSKMKQEHLPAVLSTYIEPAFGASHVKTIWTSVSTAADQTYGYAIGGIWQGGKCELMTQAMVYGCIPFTDSKFMHTNLWARYSAKTQLPLFRFNMELQGSWTTNSFWLQDVAQPGGFANADDGGETRAVSASAALGCRPCFCIS